MVSDGYACVVFGNAAFAIAGGPACAGAARPPTRSLPWLILRTG